MKKYFRLFVYSFVYKFVIFLFSFINIELCYSQSYNSFLPAKRITKGPVVILKVDDYWDTKSPNWLRFYQLIEKYNICANIGVITSYLQEKSDNIDYVKELQKIYYTNNAGEVVKRYEFWNHGFNHFCGNDTAEFYNQSFNYQYNHLMESQIFFKNTLGFESNTFGSAGNHLDQNTKAAIDTFNLAHNHQIKIWYGNRFYFSNIDFIGWNYINKYDDGNTKHLIFDITFSDVTYDFPVGAFKWHYNRGDYKKLPFLVIQIHPSEWLPEKTDACFNELESIISLLKSQDAFFVTPSYYHKNIQYFTDFYGAKEENSIAIIYPNPNNGIFTIDFNIRDTESTVIIVYDFFGQVIKRINGPLYKEKIDILNQPAGIYTVKIMYNKNIYSYRILKTG